MASNTIPEFKVILVGDSGVGKTSIFRRFASNTFIDTTRMTREQSRASTLGLDHMNKRFDCQDKSIKLQLWDTGGLERQRTTVRVATMNNSYYKFAKAGEYSR